MPGRLERAQKAADYTPAMVPESPIDGPGRVPGSHSDERARQDIPRPPWAFRVEPAIDGLESEDPGPELTMGAVRIAFTAGAASLAPAAPPPAPASAAGAGPAPAPPASPAGAAAPGAAVLITLVPAEGSGDAAPAAVVLIRRAAHLRRNPGEVAFPGGGIEPGEAPLAAALREAEEEVGLSPGAVDILGRLSTPGRTRRTDLIVPYVAAARELPRLAANAGEVEAILVVPLVELLTTGRYWQERWDENDSLTWTMHFFDLGEDVIWGATARMLYALLLRLLRGRETSPLL